PAPRSLGSERPERSLVRIRATTWREMPETADERSREAALEAPGDRHRPPHDAKSRRDACGNNCGPLPETSGRRREQALPSTRSAPASTAAPERAAAPAGIEPPIFSSPLHHVCEPSAGTTRRL